MKPFQDPSIPVNHRILVIDDNPAIHEDFRKVLNPTGSQLAGELDDDEASLFGDQGQEGLEMVRAAELAGKPYAVAFVDVRMPPGWDGIETISHIWKEFPGLQIVICTAYSDYSWDEISEAVGNTDHVLVLKKPFDNVEVMQMAHALSKKWQLTQIANRQMAELDALVNKRTMELREANARLTGEVAERAAAQDALRVSEERFSKAFHDGDPADRSPRLPRRQRTIHRLARLFAGGSARGRCGFMGQRRNSRKARFRIERAKCRPRPRRQHQDIKWRDP
jgi:CheY-like chemotaxis protein